MNAVEYLKEKARMTEGCGIHHCSEKCPLNSSRNGLNISCNNFENNYPEKAIEIVENWAKENPLKTYLSVLLEKLPHVRVWREGFPNICVSELFNTEKYCNDHSINCKDCWNREYKEEK